MIRAVNILRRGGFSLFRGFSSATPQIEGEKSVIQTGTVKTKCFSNFASEMEYVAILPPGYEPHEKLPLLLSLHGGGQSAKDLHLMLPDFEARWKGGQLPRCVVASFSTLHGMGFYHNYYDGSLRYMDFFMTEWLPFLQQKFGVSSARSHTWLGGGSMGGLGALRLVFTHPDVFAGAATLEPGVDPVFDPSDLLDRNLMLRGDFKLISGMQTCHGSLAAETRAMFGSVNRKEWNMDSYHSYNPACIVRSNAVKIRDKEPRIYFDAADNDLFNLHDGAEFLHKTLWQYRILHEYHLCYKADHCGPSLIYRYDDMMKWLCRNMKEVLEPSKKALTPGQELYVSWLEKQDTFIPSDDAKPPEGAEPLTVFDQGFLDYCRKHLPDCIVKHADSPCEGVDRL